MDNEINIQNFTFSPEILNTHVGIKLFVSFRAEIIGAILNGFFLLIMAIFVIYMGYMRLGNPI